TVGRMRLPRHETTVLEKREHLRHRRGLNPLDTRKLAWAHRPVLAERGQRGKLSESDRHVDALIAYQPGQPQQRGAQRPRHLCRLLATHCVIHIFVFPTFLLHGQLLRGPSQPVTLLPPRDTRRMASRKGPEPLRPPPVDSARVIGIGTAIW